MTNHYSGSDEGIIYKISILALTAVFIGAAVFFRTGGGEDFLRSREKSCFLSCTDSRLILRPAGKTEIVEGDISSLPVNLMPLFFRPIPFNDAGYDLLLTIPGVGPRTAEAMIEKRKEMGRFSRAEELEAIRGIGSKKVLILKQYLTFE